MTGRTEPGTDVTIRTTVPELRGNFDFVTLHAKVRASSQRDAGDGWSIGTQTVEIDDDSRRRMVAFCHVVHPYRQLRGRRELPDTREEGLETPGARVMRLRAELREAIAAVEQTIASSDTAPQHKESHSRSGADV